MYLSSSGAHPGLVAGNNTVAAANAPYDDGTAAAFEASNGEDAPAAAASSSSLLYTAPASASDIYAPPISREQELSQRQRMFDNSIMQPYKKEAEFVQLLLTIEGRTLSKELFSFLFDMVRRPRPAAAPCTHARTLARLYADRRLRCSSSTRASARRPRPRCRRSCATSTSSTSSSS